MKPNRLVMYPGFMSSSDAHEFKKTLGVMLVYRDGKYQPQRGDFIIGWGNSRRPTWADDAEHYKIPVINKWEAIRNAVDKSVALNMMHQKGVSTIPFTENTAIAKEWLRDGHTVIARTELRGMKGAGIVVIKGREPLVHAPLYSQFQPDCQEFRCHVAFGKVINYQEKRRKNGVKVDPYVRSEENGWVFCRKNVVLPDAVGQEAIKAVKALGLDFGGVDVLYAPRHQPGMRGLAPRKAMILEVNTAPGLDYEYGIESYTEAIQNAIRNH